MTRSEPAPVVAREAGQPPASVEKNVGVPAAETHAEHHAAHAAHEEHEEEHVEGLWYGSFDYLFFKARRCDMSYAIVDPANNGIPEGSIEGVNWPGRSGLRATIGRRFDGSAWEMAVSYTLFHSAGSSQVAPPPGGVLYATLAHPGTVEQVASARADSSFNYNVYDLEFARNCRENEWVTLRPLGGLRFAHIDQNLNAFYNGIDANMDMVSTGLKYEGVGLRMGGEGRWNFGGCPCCRAWGSGWSLYGRMAGSLLVGDFEGRWQETNNNVPGTVVNVTESFTKVVPVLELGLGVAWQYRNFSMRAGYEMSNWFGLWDMPEFVDDVHQGKFVRQNGDVSLDGLMLRAELGF